MILHVNNVYFIAVGFNTADVTRNIVIPLESKINVNSEIMMGLLKNKGSTATAINIKGSVYGGVLTCFLYTFLMSFHQVIPHFLLLLIVMIFVWELFLVSEKSLNRMFLFLTIILGLTPNFSWLNLPNFINPIAIALSIWIIQIGKSFISKSNRQRPMKKDLICVTFLGASFLFYLWMKPISDGSPVEVLTRILPIWDHSAHFLFFMSYLVNGRNIPSLPNPSINLQWEGMEYPTGIHYVWSNLVSPSQLQLSTFPENAIPSYVNLVNLSQSLSILVFGLSIFRLAESFYIKFLSSALSIGIWIGLVAVGPLSQIMFVGFANISAVLIGSSILGSALIKPFTNVKSQLGIILLAVNIISYNWYPALLLFLIPLLFELGRLNKSLKRDKSKIYFFPIFISPLAPVIQSLSLGVDHLELDGGILPVPFGIFVFLVLILFSFALIGKNMGINRAVYWLGFSPPFLIIAVGIYLRISTGRYSYYFHKTTLIVMFYCVFTILALSIKLLESRGSTASFMSEKIMNNKIIPTKRITLRSSAAAIIAGISFSQLFGYFGPDYSNLVGSNAAWGVLKRADVLYGEKTYTPTVDILIREAKLLKNLPVEEKSCYLLYLSDDIGTESNQNYGWRLILANIWLHSLSNSYTKQAKEQTYMLPSLNESVASDVALAEGIEKVFDRRGVCILSTNKVISELKSKGEGWRTKIISTD